MDLKQFGQTLRRLRKGAGLTQGELAREVGVSEQLLSIWERAYQHGDRVWQPDHPSIVRLIEIFTDRLTPQDANIWAVQAGHSLDESETVALFPQATDFSPPPPDLHLTRQRLDHLSEQRLFGVDVDQAKLSELLQAKDRAWLLSLDGMGGIGKTSLAHALVRDSLDNHRFYDIAWLSAKQEEFLPEGVLRKIIQPALTPETFVDTLLTQLDPTLGLTRKPDEKLAILSRWLKAEPYLVVVDNLETAIDSENLIPLLQQLANPSKFLITTRFSLRTMGRGIHSHSLKGLSDTDAFDFLRYEGDTRNIVPLAQASDDQLRKIYDVVGGNPLALKLVVGQLTMLPLGHVLISLQEANTDSSEDLYTYIYWQAWDMLSEEGRQILVSMPLAQDGNFDDIVEESELEPTEVGPALKHLITLSLIEVGGDLMEPTYRIHRLTETFLLNEVIKWQSM